MFVDGCQRIVLKLTLYLLYLSSVQYANCLSKERENRHLFPLLGYLHGYKIGQNFALQLPPFVISPVVLMPSVNQQQSVNIQKSKTGENYQENGGTFQIISPAKLVSNIIEAKYEDDEMVLTEPKQPPENNILLKTNTPFENNLTDKDSFRQIISNDGEETITVEYTATENESTTPITDITGIELENLNATTQLHGPYPTAVYKNENISTLSITTSSLQLNSTPPNTTIEQNLTLPHLENNFENFSIKYPNKYEYNDTVTSIDKQSNGPLSNVNIYSHTDVSQPISKGYSYPNPWYNAMVNKLSITTNSYTNNESPLPPAYDDRWKSFSQLRKSYPTSDFRPLAGLYHDGFLHKTLFKKTGFIPVNSKYLYNH